MRVNFGNQKVTLEPVPTLPRDTSRAIELITQALSIYQRWHCDMQRAEPPVPIKKMNIETNLMFHIKGLGYSDADRRKYRRQGRALANKFAADTGVPLNRLNAVLQRTFGKKENVPIPYDAKMLKDRDKFSKELLSRAVYSYLKITYPGLKANQEIILSVPRGVVHSVILLGQCEGGVFTGYETSHLLDFYGPIGPPNFIRFDPTTRLGRQAAIYERRHRLGELREQGEEHRERIRQIERELRELQDQ